MFFRTMEESNCELELDSVCLLFLHRFEFCKNDCQSWVIVGICWLLARRPAQVLGPALAVLSLRLETQYLQSVARTHNQPMWRNCGLQEIERIAPCRRNRAATNSNWCVVNRCTQIHMNLYEVTSHRSIPERQQISPYMVLNYCTVNYISLHWGTLNP